MLGERSGQRMRSALKTVSSEVINLRTGTPGACKTLSAVEALSKMQARWEKHPEEARPVFVHNVKDLALPHSPVPLKEWKEGGNKPSVMVPDWDAMPDGSFVICDEAQAFFPPRSSASTPPPHVAWLNTHRHRGFDIEVITQHPKLIDGSVRALVGKHQHFRRMFGRKASYCYEWDACSDSLSGLNNAVGGLYRFPKGAFKWYKSAEIHTKQNFKLPKFLLIPLVGVAIGVYAIPKATNVLMNGVSGKTLDGRDLKTAAYAGIGASAPVGAAALAAASSPANAQAGIVQRAVDVIKPARITGCMATPVRCLCVDEMGRAADVKEEVCRESSEKLGGLVSYDMDHRPSGNNGRASFAAETKLSDNDQFKPSQAGPAITTPQRPITPGAMVLSRLPPDKQN